jgi:hypothetical protein
MRIHSTYPSIRAIDSFEEGGPAFVEQNESERRSEGCLQSRQMRPSTSVPSSTSTQLAIERDNPAPARSSTGLI